MSLSETGKKLRRNPVLFVCAVLLPIMAIVMFMRGPKIDLYEEDINQLELRWRQMQTNLERSGNLDEDVAAIATGAEQLNHRLMIEEEVAANYEFFYGLEAQVGLKIRSFSKSQVSNGEGMRGNFGKLQHFQVIPFTLGLEGDFNQVLHFLELLRAQPYVVHLEGLNLSRPAGAKDSSLLSANLRCAVLAQKAK